MEEPKPPDSGFSLSPMVIIPDLVLNENDNYHPHVGTESEAMSTEDS